MDPQINELGQVFALGGMMDRDQAKELFLVRINKLARLAQEKGIKILIENNVLSHKYLTKNPFLMIDHKESLEIMQNTGKCWSIG